MLLIIKVSHEVASFHEILLLYDNWRKGHDQTGDRERSLFPSPNI
jgi:hypothetical protein